MSLFKTDIPDSLDGMTKKQILQWINENGIPYISDKYSSENLASLLLGAAKANGLELSNEQFLFVMDNSPRLLNEACAGSGKTTISQMKLLMEKLANGYKGRDILAIAYNEHAAKDMINTHKELVSSVRSKDSDKLFDIDMNIHAKTFNAFAYMIVNQFHYKTKFAGNLVQDRIQITPDWKIEGFLKDIIKDTFKQKEIAQDVYDGQIKALIALHAYKTESLAEISDLVELKIYKDCKMDLDVVNSIIERYDRSRLSSGYFTFIDQIIEFENLIDNCPDVLEFMHKLYKVYVIDEFQDISNKMRRIIKKITTDKTKLICIGDGDQAIYSFRGTDSLNCLKFKQEFGEGSKIYTMTVNRRCREEIVDFANYMVSTNVYRLPKSLKSNKSGGNVNNVFCDEDFNQYEFVRDELKKPFKGSTYITARTNSEVTVIAYKLLRDNVPVFVKEELEPFKDFLSKTFNSVLELLITPNHRETIIAVAPKITPLTREQMKILADVNKRGLDFYDYELAQFSAISGINDVLETIRSARQALVKGAKMSEYMPQMFQLLKKYFWDYFRRTNTAFPQEIEDYVTEYMFRDRTYEDMVRDRGELRQRLEGFRLSSSSAFISTMHGLKGLEYDRGFILNLNSSFPKEDASAEKTPEELNSMREEEMRLLYVAITRSRDNVTLMWDVEDCSLFLDYVVGYESAKVGGENLELTQLDFQVPELLLDEAEVDFCIPDILVDEVSLIANEEQAIEVEFNPSIPVILEDIAVVQDETLIIDNVVDDDVEVYKLSEENISLNVDFDSIVKDYDYNKKLRNIKEVIVKEEVKQSSNKAVNGVFDVNSGTYSLSNYNDRFTNVLTFIRSTRVAN